jgi:23S rRNA (cytidine2498-2'-O)-methyltransferase
MSIVKTFSVCIAPSGFEQELALELSRLKVRVEFSKDRLFVVRSEELPKKPLWSQWFWADSKMIEFSSISEAQKILKADGKFWSLHPVGHFRRAELIQKDLPRFKIPAISGFESLSQVPLGGWTLLEPNKILFSSKTDSSYPDGEIPFVENKTGPPSRAYLKLWEILCREHGKSFSTKTAIDLGAAPGGWTWLLAQCFEQVVAVDKAELAPSVLKMKNVRHLRQDAFSLKAHDIPDVKAVFSDIICYPSRLLELYDNWKDTGVELMAFTIKFKGHTDWESIERLRQIPSSTIFHATANKHELTWLHHPSFR